MVLPMYLFVLLAAAIFVAAVCVGYYFIYKTKSSEDSNGADERKKSMPAPSRVAAVLTIIFLLVAVIISFFIKQGISNPKTPEGQIDADAFYAEVKEVGDNTVTVTGIPLNDESYRGEFTYELYDGIPLEWHGQPISLSDLDEGDLVSVILLTDIGGTEDVFKIKLLDDEM